MPRRNLFVLLVVTLVALLCYQRAQTARYGRVLADAMAKIENRYVEPIEAAQLFEAAMQGMVGRLDDYSAYIPPKGLREFNEEIDQKFVGIGMELGQDPQTRQLFVRSPMVDSPAYKAGIRAGDRLVTIGDQSTQGMSAEDAIALMRGKPGDPVTLSVLHAGDDKPAEIRIVREMIAVPTVLGDRRKADGSWDFFLDGRQRIGYVRITSISDNTPDELQDALEWLSEHEMRGLVIDLRGDPGGYLDAAVDICDLLIDRGQIVTTRRRDRIIDTTYDASGDGPFTAFPMAVLIDSQSASAAEILAACLQDNHRAMIVGERSYGKGSVQEIMPLENGCGAMKITTASYWRPSGRNIQRPHKDGDKGDWGVSPDPGYGVRMSKEEESRRRQWRDERDAVGPAVNGAAEPRREAGPPFVDRPLERAIQYVEKKAG